MDYIVAADVILADGLLVHASESDNMEVFWAIHGAADSFGIVTTFYLSTELAPETIIYFAYSFEDALYRDKETFKNASLHIQKVAKNASVMDRRLSWGMILNTTSYNLIGTFFGTIEEYESKVQPELLRDFIQPNSITVQSYDWITYLTVIGAVETITIPTTGYDEHDDFFVKSITVPEASSGLISNACGTFYDFITVGGPPDGYFIIFNLYGGLGSQINGKDTDFAAYSSRDSLWIIQIYGLKSRSIDYIESLNKAVISAQPEASFGAYINYVDPSYDTATAHKLYYGDKL